MKRKSWGKDVDEIWQQETLEEIHDILDLVITSRGKKAAIYEMQIGAKVIKVTVERVR